MSTMEKPQCGGDGQGGEYDVALHAAGLFLVMGASLFGAGFPVVAKKYKSLKIPPKIFFFCKHFGTGVLIATAFVHLIPTAFQSLNDPCLPALFNELYAPLPGVIMMASLFILFVIEMWLHSKTEGGHSHGGTGGSLQPSQANGEAVVVAPVKRSPTRSVQPPTPISDPVQFQTNRYKSTSDNWDEKTLYAKETNGSSDPYLDSAGSVKSEMPPWFIVFYEKYVAQQQWISSRLDEVSTYGSNRGTVSSVEDLKGKSRFSTYEQDAENADPEAVDPLVLKKMSLQITLIEGGILFHSVFVGMTVSITVDGFIVLLVAILFHQMFEGLGLGSRIAAVPYPKGSIRPWLLVVAFGTTAPIGQAIGLITRNTYDPNSAFGLIIVGVFNAISSGLLVYAALVDLLAADFLSHEADETMTKRDKRNAFIYVLMGAAGMAAVGAFA